MCVLSVSMCMCTGVCEYVCACILYTHMCMCMHINEKAYNQLISYVLEIEIYTDISPYCNTQESS